MMQHLTKLSTATNDTTRKDLESTLFKLEGKMSKNMSFSRSHTSPNKVVKLGMFTMLYSVFSLCGCYYCGVNIHNYQTDTKSIDLLKTAEKEIITIYSLNKRLQSFFEMTNEEMTEHDLSVITFMLADLYELYLGHNLANETILSMLCMDDMSKILLHYKDTKFIFDSFFLIIDQIGDKLISRLMSDVSTRNQDPLVRVCNVVRASALLEKCHYLLKMGCSFPGEFEYRSMIFKYLNYVKGHLMSLFMVELVANTTDVIRDVDKFIFSYSSFEQELTVDNMSCDSLIQSRLSINVSTKTLNIGHEIILKEIQLREGRASSTHTNLIVSIIVLVGTCAVCAVLVIAYKFKLEQLSDLKFCDNLLEEENAYETDFCMMTMTDAIPKQLLSAVSLKANENVTKNENDIKHDSDDDADDDVFHSVSFDINLHHTHGQKSSSFPYYKNARHKKRTTKSNSLRYAHSISRNGIFADDPYNQELTVMMIDVVNFNSLLNYLSASEVVNITTHISRLLDDRASYYDVFVASKGSPPFTVISGYCEEQKLHHSSQIANMALDLCVSCGDIEVDNVPDSKLRLRIGIHTDYGYATVVSHPRKRFHVYGEILKTVQVLQKTSFCNKIQISESTHKLLTKKPVYNIQKHGCIDLKNGKKMCTYWLLGKRISVASMPPEIGFKGKSIIEHPIELEQRPLYEFDADERMPPAWTHAHLFQPDDHSMPHCSFHSLSYSSTNQAVSNT